MAHHATSTALALLIFLLCRHVHVDAATTLSQGQSLAGNANETLLSANGAFSLSFFSPRVGDGSRVYLGVMYAKAAEQTVPWVANRDAPVSGAASSYSATVTDSGDLRVLEGERVVWQTNTTSSVGNFTLTIQDTGNLVLAGGSGAQAVQLWQSFDYPADTFLPGMKITLARRDGAVVRQTLFRSWRSPDDPAAGNFTLGQDPLGSAQLNIWRSQDGKNMTHWRSGQWVKGSFVGIPWRPLNLYGFQLSGDLSQSNGLYYTFHTFNSSQYRFVLQPDGTETCYQLVDATGAWEVVWSQPTMPCQAYNTCGPNAECSAADHCSCLKG